MGKVIFSDARAWRYLMTAIGKIIEEGVLKFTEEAAVLKAMDPSHIVLIDLYMPRSIFEEYDVSGEEKLGVNFGDIVKIFKRATKNDRLALEFSKNKLAILFLGSSERKFVLPLLSLSEEEIPEPKIEFNVMARMTSATFRDVLRDIEPVSEAIKFIGEEGGVLRVIGYGSKGEAEVQLSSEAGTLIDISVKERSEAAYSFEYFKDISSASQAAETAVIRFSTNIPCRLDFELAGEARLSFYIAPRIE